MNKGATGQEEKHPGVRKGSLKCAGGFTRLEVNPTPREQARSKVHELRPINKRKYLKVSVCVCTFHLCYLM